MLRLSVLGIFLVLIIALALGLQKPQKQEQVKIGKTSINVEVADTPDKRDQGLSNRKSLNQDSGMLFVFDQKDRHPFWMKQMHFDLDFIWIADDKVVDITENVPKPTDPNNLPQYVPKELVNYVLEVNSGFVRNHQIKLGDKVEIFH